MNKGEHTYTIRVESGKRVLLKQLFDNCAGIKIIESTGEVDVIDLQVDKRCEKMPYEALTRQNLIWYPIRENFRQPNALELLMNRRRKAGDSLKGPGSSPKQPRIVSGGRKETLRCPFHEDTRPSAFIVYDRYDTNLKRFYCSVCTEKAVVFSGDIASLAEQMQN